MKKLILQIFVIASALTLFAQELQHEATAINIEVPVRVYDGNKFVENLTLKDFILYEDGKRQKIEAVYLIKKRTIKSKESLEKEGIVRKEDLEERFAQDEPRHFFLVFDILDFMPKIKKTIEFFFQNVMQPEDTLQVVTPLNTYKFHNELFKTKSKEDITSALTSILKKDVRGGNTEYKRIIEDIRKITRAIVTILSPSPMEKAFDEYSSDLWRNIADSQGGLPYLLSSYRSYLSQLERIRGINQKALLDFGESLKDMDGQKYVFLLYQREFIPKLAPRILSQSRLQNDPQSQMDIVSLMELYNRDYTLDIDLIKRAYAEPSISAHFMFLTKIADRGGIGVQMRERSTDVFSAFRELALATGGKVESSSNPEYLFKQAVEASENYYILYYTPKNYKADGKFKKIKVKVKGKKYRVTHRAGYVAD